MSHVYNFITHPMSPYVFSSKGILIHYATSRQRHLAAWASASWFCGDCALLLQQLPPGAPTLPVMGEMRTAINMRIAIHTYMHACIHTCIHAYMHAYMHTLHYITLTFTFRLHYIHTYVRTYIHTYIPYHTIPLHCITLHYITYIH